MSKEMPPRVWIRKYIHGGYGMYDHPPHPVEEANLPFTVYVPEKSVEEALSLARLQGRLEVYEEQMIEAAEEDSPGLIYWREKFNETYAEIQARSSSGGEG